MTSARKLAFISDGAAAGARAIAERLVSHGMRVMLNLGPDQDEEGAKTAFGKDLWESVLWSRGDLSQGASAGRVLSQTIEQFGTVDVLIHNSQWIVATSLEHADCRTYQDSMAVNVKSAFFLTQAFARQPTLEDSRIIYVSSIHAEKPTGSSFVYSVGKGALGMLAREAALDLGRRGASVNVIEMGPVEGDDQRFASEISDLYQYYRYKVPSTVLGTFEDLAHLIWFLSLPESRFINGSTIRLDGGFSLHYMNHKMKLGHDQDA